MVRVARLRQHHGVPGRRGGGWQAMRGEKRGENDGRNLRGIGASHSRSSRQPSVVAADKAHPAEHRFRRRRWRSGLSGEGAAINVQQT